MSRPAQILRTDLSNKPKIQQRPAQKKPSALDSLEKATNSQKELANGR
jgi:hypothetical protein